MYTFDVTNGIRFLLSTPERIRLLLSELDSANERLSSKATVAICKREYNLFGKSEYQRLSEISVAHLYHLRQGSFYRNHTLTVEKTKPSPFKSMGSAGALIHKVDQATYGWTRCIKEISMG